MDRDDIETLECALMVLGRMEGLRLADDLARGILDLLDAAQLVGLLDDGVTDEGERERAGSRAGNVPSTFEDES